MTPEFWIAAATLALEVARLGRDVWIKSRNESPDDRKEDGED